MTQPQKSVTRTFLSAFFFSTSEPRLRAGWRLLIQVILQICLMLIGAIVIFLPFIDISGITNVSGLPYLIVSEGIEFISILISIYLVRRFLDKRSLISLGLQIDIRSLTDVFIGIGITFLMMGLIFFFELLQGWISISSFAWDGEPLQNVVSQVASFLFVFVLVAWNEELMSRGYHLQTIASGTNLFWGLIISSVVFGALHLANPGASWISALGIFFAGLFLGYAYLRTKRLWLSMGLHFGWNFFEGVIFGFPVSGLNIYHLINLKVFGPARWTGGEFGPEAGLIVLPALGLGSLLVYFYSRLNNNS
jgi:membrane protease YdiL (CAAX protease family)